MADTWGGDKVSRTKRRYMLKRNRGPMTTRSTHRAYTKLTHGPTYRNPEERQRYQYASSRKDGVYERHLRSQGDKNPTNNTPYMHHDQENV